MKEYERKESEMLGNKKTEGRKGKGMETGKNKKKATQAKASQAYCPSDYLVLGFKILL